MRFLIDECPFGVACADEDLSADSAEQKLGGKAEALTPQTTPARPPLGERPRRKLTQARSYLFRSGRCGSRSGRGRFPAGLLLRLILRGSVHRAAVVFRRRGAGSGCGRLRERDPRNCQRKCEAENGRCQLFHDVSVRFLFEASRFRFLSCLPLLCMTRPTINPTLTRC